MGSYIVSRLTVKKVAILTLPITGLLASLLLNFLLPILAENATYPSQPQTDAILNLPHIHFHIFFPLIFLPGGLLGIIICMHMLFIKKISLLTPIYLVISSIAVSVGVVVIALPMVDAIYYSVYPIIQSLLFVSVVGCCFAYIFSYLLNLQFQWREYLTFIAATTTAFSFLHWLEFSFVLILPLFYFFTCIALSVSLLKESNRMIQPLLISVLLIFPLGNMFFAFANPHEENLAFKKHEKLYNAIIRKNNRVFLKWVDEVKEMQRLDEVVSPNIRNTALKAAVNIENHFAAEELLKRGANPDPVIHMNKTPLHFVKDKRMAEILLEHGARLHSSKDWLFQFIQPSALKDTSFLDLLISHGLDLNYMYNFGGRNHTLLAAAIDRNDVELVEVLLNRGVDLNAPLYEGSSLYPISFSKTLEMTNFLISQGALVHENMRLSLNNRYEQDQQVLEVLLDSGLSPSAAWNAHRFTTDTSTINLLLARGADINDPQEHSGRTALIVHALKNDLEMIRFLIEKGADLHIRDKAGKTAYIHARNDQIKSYLWNKGRGIRIPSEQSTTQQSK